MLQWKKINVAYSESVFVALGMQHEMSMRHIVMCGLLACTLFFHIFSQTEISDTSYWTQNFGHKLLNTEFRTQVTEHRISDTSYWKQNFGHNLLTTEFRAQVTEHRISGKITKHGISHTSYWKQNFGHKLLKIRISDTSYWTQNFGHQLLNTEFILISPKIFFRDISHS
jgi:hypothetical protein